MRPKWYLSTVKPKENKSWTPGELNQVYTMRVGLKLPSEKIAKKLHLSKCQVYNATRLMKKSVHNKCYTCGNPLAEDELDRTHLFNLCKKCKKEIKEYKHNLREEHLSHKMCGYCGKRRALKSRTACIRCISATHRRRYKKGLCGVCGENKIREDGEALCYVCAERMRNSYQTGATA